MASGPFRNNVLTSGGLTKLVQSFNGRAKNRKSSKLEKKAKFLYKIGFRHDDMNAIFFAKG